MSVIAVCGPFWLGSHFCVSNEFQKGHKSEEVVKVTVKFSQERAIKVQRGSRGIAVLFF